MIEREWSIGREFMPYLLCSVRNLKRDSLLKSFFRLRCPAVIGAGLRRNVVWMARGMWRESDTVG